ncbi:MAG: hypothetical protein KME08_13090 [Aphanothece sp. CMT-3BRIN-NPC111]|nr:hypothetical protein [Aphanothece sp. CMT-3BRIN-NPC111]
MRLIYRCEIFEYTPPCIQSYRKPCALNWRFQAPGETYDSVAIYSQSRALNWRYRVTTGV